MSTTKLTTKKAADSRMSKASAVAISNGVAYATLKSHNQTPRKVRLVTELIKGKKVQDALVALEFLPKRAAEPIMKLLQSAIANAKVSGEDVDTLRVQSIIVESAGILKKYMPRAFGRASLIRRRKSAVKLTLGAAPASK
ncbi:MAG: 50S ribosomal protein L22 [Candidatus Kaiserbacteria bacterium]|nr:50S ribosomal protein L22 [Candidatus Kaiserbacteria bacterium]